MPFSKARGFEMGSVEGPTGMDFPHMTLFLVEFQPDLILLVRKCYPAASTAFKVDNAVLF